MATHPHGDGGHRFVPGSYHTDGTRRLRIVTEEADGELVAIEDYRSLQLMLVPRATCARQS